MKKSPPVVATKQAGHTLDWSPIVCAMRRPVTFLRAIKRKALKTATNITQFLLSAKKLAVFRRLYLIFLSIN